MGQHLRGRLGPAGRAEIARLQLEDGLTERAAAAALSVAPGTARRWKLRRLGASPEELASRAWTLDRCSRPHRCPRQTPPELERRVCQARERTGWGPRLLVGRDRGRALDGQRDPQAPRRSRAPRPARDAVRRYEWPCPGDLLHMDVKRYPRFRRPGHAVTGDRTSTQADKRDALGHDYFHAIVDDHSRLAYGELLADERAATVTAFVERALAWFAGHGITTRRVMTDGAWSLHPQPLAARAARPSARSATSSRRPTRRAGTARSSASTRRWNASGPRACATATAPPETAHCHTGSRHYNQRRPHSSLGGRPPISRAHNLPGQDS